MGIYDREYYREDEKYGIHLTGTRSMTTNLLIANVGIYIVCVFTPTIESFLAATPATLAQPWMWWQFLSYGFIHSDREAWHLVGNMIGLWFFGREVEQVWGRMELLRIYLVVAALGGIVWASRLYFGGGEEFLNIQLIGASGAVVAIIMLFVFKFPTRMILLMFVLPVPAWAVGVMVVLNDIRGVAHLVNNDFTRVAFDVHLVGAVFAACYYRFGWNLGRLVPSIAVPSFKRRPNLRVHDPDELHGEDEVAEDFYEELDERGDAVLAKLHREGEDSLSAEERRILEAYARRMQQKHR